MADVAAIILGGMHVWREDPFHALGPRLLLPIANEPLLERMLAWLSAARVPSLALAANHGIAAFERYLGDGLARGLDVQYCVDATPRGPAGSARDAADVLDADTLVVVEGTILPGVSLPALLAEHAASGAAATVVVNQVADEAADLIHDQSPAGIYVFARDALGRVPATGYQDIKEAYIPSLVKAGLAVMAYPAEQPSPRITALDSYLAAQGWVLDRLEAEAGLPPGYECRHGACVHVTAEIAEDVRPVGAVMIGPRARVESDVVLVGPTVIGPDAVVETGAVLGRSVLWTRSVVHAGATVDHTLVADGVAVPAGAVHYGDVCTERPQVAGQPA
jgi:NDP-sugar pyrophosphorylase family protein